MSRREYCVQRIAQWARRSGALSVFRSAACMADRLGNRLQLDRPWRRGGLVFMFHRIAERQDLFRPAFPQKLFAQFCEHAAKHYDVLPLSELERRRRVDRDLSRSIAITFDDGYADNYQLAFPLLRRYQLPATLFVTTGAVRGGTPLWTSRVGWILEHGQAEQAPAYFVDCPLLMANMTQRAITAHMLIDRLRLFDATHRDELLDELAQTLRVTNDEELDTDMVSWDELREMDRGGFAAQPHTVTHPMLSLLTEEHIETEIAQSKAEIETHLGRPAELFAYPYGHTDDFDERAIRIVQRLGLSAAYSTTFAAIRPTDNPFCLPRVCIYGKTLAQMTMQIERFFYL